MRSKKLLLTLMLICATITPTFAQQWDYDVTNWDYAEWRQMYTQTQRWFLLGYMSATAATGGIAYAAIVDERLSQEQRLELVAMIMGIMNIDLNTLQVRVSEYYMQTGNYREPLWRVLQRIGASSQNRQGDRN